MSKRISRTAIVALAALALSLVVAGTAAAGYKTGKYKGTSEQTCFTDDKPPQEKPCEVSFKAAKLGVKKVLAQAISECEDGSVYQLSTDEDAPAAAPIVNGKKFEAAILPPPNSDLQLSMFVNGKLKGKKGKGKIETTGTNENGSPCSSTTEWKAKKT